MRISDWSSDVCSSDLSKRATRAGCRCWSACCAKATASSRSARSTSPATTACLRSSAGAASPSRWSHGEHPGHHRSHRPAPPPPSGDWKPMNGLRQVFWGQGGFLSPQHLQCQDAWQQRYSLRLHAQATPFYWGFEALDLREDALANGVAEIDRFTLITRDGRSEEHTSELQSLMRLSYAVFCLKKTTSTQDEQPHKTL